MHRKYLCVRKKLDDRYVTGIHFNLVKLFLNFAFDLVNVD